MTEHPDSVISPEFREKMLDIAQSLDLLFNGQIGGKDRKIGFVLLTFKFGEDGLESRANYISNGADRKDITLLFRELIARWEGQPEMKGTA